MTMQTNKQNNDLWISTVIIEFEVQLNSGPRPQRF